MTGVVVVVEMLKTVSYVFLSCSSAICIVVTARFSLSPCAEDAAPS